MAGGAETSNIAAPPAIALLGQLGRTLPLVKIIGPCGERGNFGSEDFRPWQRTVQCRCRAMQQF